VTKSGTAVMTNSTERIQEMIREREAEREAERLELERSETNRRQRINRGLEL
jgi:hypothetical protein